MPSLNLVSGSIFFCQLSFNLLKSLRLLNLFLVFWLSIFEFEVLFNLELCPSLVVIFLPAVEPSPLDGINKEQSTVRKDHEESPESHAVTHVKSSLGVLDVLFGEHDKVVDEHEDHRLVEVG